MNETAKIRVIITGTTGMVGEGVLHECLQSAAVEAVLIVNRKPLGLKHPKLTEIVHADFFDLSAISDQLSGYNACFFCLGITSVGAKKDVYFKTTYTLTLNFAEILSGLNPNMVFSYVSGAGTDNSEKAKGWARVKGKTENDLAKLPFKKTYAFRPGFIKPTPGLTKTHRFYKYISWLFPIGRALYPAGFCTMKELGLAMIYVVNHNFAKKVVSGNDIIYLAKEASGH